jgi:rhodanese-related sulfurtransferase
MNRPIVQAVILVLAAFVLAMASNALASRQRKVMLVGWYPNATKTSSQPSAVSPQPKPAAVAPAPVVTTTTAAPPVTPQPPNVGRASARPVPAPAPDGLKPVLHSPAPDVLARFQQHPDKPYIEVAYDDVKALHDKGVLFLDARRTSIYEQGHIAGARTFSVWESDIDEKVNKLYEERNDPRQQLEPIVIYCSGGDCEDSHMLARKLWGLQFNNIWVYKDGFPDWEKRGGRISRGANP